jgi:diaminohydroxyphosphoribosylaminopyrimidine deaminase/5-amino-6-(5-phosphoribosylamino)uracil reductase
MKLALKLAARGVGWASPNPMVGAVVVRDGEIVGRGWHRRYGAAHAEVEALNQAGERAHGATLYVTLEPCNHEGLTPPCSRAVLAAGISRVVVAMADPNPRVAGGGSEFLRQRGVTVEMGLLAEPARRLNEAWLKWVTTGLPYVIAKAACSLDGRIATAAGESQWLTGEAARAFGHRLRHACDAILVGVGTVLADNPRLTARPGGSERLVGEENQGAQPPAPCPDAPPSAPDDVSGTGFRPVQEGAEERPVFHSVAQTSHLRLASRFKDPIRVVLDSRLRIPLTARLLHLDSPAPTLIAATENAPPKKVQALEKLGAEVLILSEDAGRVALRPLLQELGKRRITSLLVEGGADTLGSFFDARLVDKFFFFYAPKILGGPPAFPAVAGKGVNRLAEAHQVRDLTVRRLGADLLISGYLPQGSEAK